MIFSSNFRCLWWTPFWGGIKSTTGVKYCLSGIINPPKIPIRDPEVFGFLPGFSFKKKRPSDTYALWFGRVFLCSSCGHQLLKKRINSSTRLVFLPNPLQHPPPFPLFTPCFGLTLKWVRKLNKGANFLFASGRVKTTQGQLQSLVQCLPVKPKKRPEKKNFPRPKEEISALKWKNSFFIGGFFLQFLRPELFWSILGIQTPTSLTFCYHHLGEFPCRWAWLWWKLPRPFDEFCPGCESLIFQFPIYQVTRLDPWWSKYVGNRKIWEWQRKV